MQPVSERYDPQSAQRNATLISFELEVVSRKLDRFGWDRLDEAVRQRLSDDWTATLREYPIAEVQRAIAACLDAAPRRCPNEHEVKAEVLAYRKRAIERLPKAPEADRAEPPITRERAAEILAQHGFTPRKFGGEK